MEYRIYLSPREAWQAYNKKKKGLIKLNSFKENGRFIPDKEDLPASYFYQDEKAFFALDVKEEEGKALYEAQKKVSFNLIKAAVTLIPGFIMSTILPIEHLKNSGIENVTLSQIPPLAYFGAVILLISCHFVVSSTELEKKERIEWAKLYNLYGLNDFKNYLRLDENE